MESDAAVAKPATVRKTTPRRATKPAGEAGSAAQASTTQPRTTQPRTTQAKSGAAKSTTARPATSRPAPAKGAPAKRTPSTRTTASSKAADLRAADAAAVESQAPESQAPESQAPESQAPESQAPDTQAATESAESQAPKAPAKRTPAARPATQPRKPANKTAAKPASATTTTPAAKPATKTPTRPAAQPTPSSDLVAAPESAAVIVEAIENVEVVEVVAPVEREIVLKVTGLVKRFDDTTAVAGIDLEIVAGSFFGIVGPNGAGKTTTLSMVTGLLRPDAGTVTVHGADVWTNPVVAKRTMGVLPDRLRLFDRLTGSQLLYYSGILHGLDKKVVRSRSADLAAAFGLEESLDRLVTDYSAGMTKKVAIAAAMIHSPRLLVLDEPFESVDPVSAANVIEILQKYVAAGGTVVMSSHTMNLIERICDSVAVVVNGAILASGTMAQVRNGKTLEERFVELAGGRKAAEGMEWLHKFSD